MEIEAMKMNPTNDYAQQIAENSNTAAISSS